MQILKRAHYQTLVKDARVLSADNFGDKVLALENGRIIKLFRLKRLFSSAFFFPYSVRFARNANTLKNKGIPTVSGARSFWIPYIKRTAVIYTPLPGDNLREIGQVQQELPDELVRMLGIFLAGLHNKGVYFKSNHLGNIVLTPERKLGLIDMADMRFFPFNLPPYLRVNNFRRMLKYREDAEFLFPDNKLGAFYDAYFSASNQSANAAAKTRTGFDEKVRLRKDAF